MTAAAPVRIPVYAPLLGGNERRYVDECLDTTWISSRGAFVGRFESAFASFVGAPHATSVCNGTVALHLALAALGLGRGDEVVVPTLTYIASVNTVEQTGATPVFADSRRDTWQLDPDDVRRKLTPRTRAIMAVHLYGQSCDMDALVAIAREHGLALVEDCAEAFGTRWRGRHVGTFGDVATFSFFGNKTITTGEGGMVVARDPVVHARCAKLKNQGVSADREYWHDELAYNYRMTNVAAAIGVAQLERAEAIIARKRELHAHYRAALAGLPVELHAEASGTTHSFWMNSILVAEPSLRDPLRRHLALAGIETRPLFHPAHTMPMYAARGERHPVAESLGARGINLPSGPGVGGAEVAEVAAAIGAFLR
ncbi:MAG: aminotransferase class I/II-fold pyridoxal phosphate-dependent enzyme [Burkholderiales bacterium]|nr:aminotransferase class I/II-fold pyridoxal phosphate-dependent enzyme [Burkholderiales bacterium]